MTDCKIWDLDDDILIKLFETNHGLYRVCSGLYRVFLKNREEIIANYYITNYPMKYVYSNSNIIKMILHKQQWCDPSYYLLRSLEFGDRNLMTYILENYKGFRTNSEELIKYCFTADDNSTLTLLIEKNWVCPVTLHTVRMAILGSGSESMRQRRPYKRVSPNKALFLFNYYNKISGININRLIKTALNCYNYSLFRAVVDKCQRESLFKYLDYNYN